MFDKRYSMALELRCAGQDPSVRWDGAGLFAILIGNQLETEPACARDPGGATGRRRQVRFRCTADDVRADL